ncbi:MAG TPA: hypothetical protein VLH56_06145 [Dissulfurispiraceae bacterium]|nr:hypothetical protein [Dissulfurispiraceae bacterium]
MVEAVFGLVGVAVGSVFTLIGIYLQQQSVAKRWKIERQIMYIENERERCRKVFDAAVSHVLPLIPGMDSRSADLCKLLLFQMPPEVLKELTRLSEKGAIQTPEEGLGWILAISKHMSDYLESLDRQIRNLLS